MYSNILTELKTILDGVTGIGETDDYLRLSHDEQNNISLFVNSSKLHTWYLTRSKCISERYDNKYVLRNHYFEVHGIYVLDDANESEKTFNSLVDTVLNEFQEKANINLTTNSRLIEVSNNVNIEHREFVNVLCHYCLISLIVEETKAIERFYFKDWADCEWVLDDNELDKNQLDLGY